jgi:hypothetical protein
MEVTAIEKRYLRRVTNVYHHVQALFEPHPEEASEYKQRQMRTWLVKKYKKALKYAKQGVDLEGEESREFLFKEIVIYEKCNDYQSAYDTALEYTKRYPEDEKGQKELKFLETRI